MFSQYSLPSRSYTETKQCLLCGSAQTTRFKYHSNLSGEGEACRLYHEVRDLDVLIEDVIPIQRVYLLRRYNAFSSTTISRIPSEILVEIFDYAIGLSRFGHRHFPVILSGVSSRWRELVHSTPFLWSEISLEFWSKCPKRLNNRINLLRLYLRHSGSAPLFLQVAYDHFATGGNQEPNFDANLIDPAVDKSLIANLHRIRELSLENASTRWLSYTPQITDLQDFRFKGRHGPTPDAPVISFADSHRLSNLSLTDWSAIKFTGSGNFNELTIIALESMEVTVCAYLLAACPNLVEYRCQSPKHPSVSSLFRYEPWKAIVILENLKVFEWEVTNQDDLAEVEGAMFRFLHLPSLISLKLLTRQHCQHPSLHIFCKRLTRRLTRLYISFCCINDAEDVCLFNSIPPECDVRVLTLRAHGFLRFFKHTLMALENTKRFPMLNHLIIDDRNQGNDRWGRHITLDYDFASLIHKMLIQRADRATFILGFYIKISWFTVKWPKDVASALRGLTQSGKFRLTIREEMNPFNSLPQSFPPRYL